MNTGLGGTGRQASRPLRAPGRLLALLSPSECYDHLSSNSALISRRSTAAKWDEDLIGRLKHLGCTALAARSTAVHSRIVVSCNVRIVVSPVPRVTQFHSGLQIIAFVNWPTPFVACLLACTLPKLSRAQHIKLSRYCSGWGMLRVWLGSFLDCIVVVPAVSILASCVSANHFCRPALNCMVSQLSSHFGYLARIYSLFVFVKSCGMGSLQVDLLPQDQLNSDVVAAEELLLHAQPCEEYSCASNQWSVKLAANFRVTNLTEWQPKLEDAMVSDEYGYQRLLPEI